MKFQSKFFVIVLFLVVFLASSFPVLARCGTYFSSQPAGENCVDAASGARFNATVRCSQNPQVCCEAQTQCTDLFNAAANDPFGDVDEDENITPVQGGDSSTAPSTTSPTGSDFQENRTRGCGSYFVTEPVASQRCINAEISGNPAIHPYVVCGNGVSCCPTASMCPVPPPQPEPEPDQLSSQQCGSLQRDGTCRDFESKIIQGAVQCRSTSDTQRIDTQCCRTIDLCEERSASTIDEDFTPIGDFEFCQQVPSGSQRSNCEACYQQAGESEGRVYTAVGCIRTGGQGLTEDLVRLLMGISGGISLLSILAGAFLYTTSQGDSSKLKEAKTLITAAISGLFFIIFSIFLLQFFGVTILRLPGLGGSNIANSGGGSGTQPADREPVEQTWEPGDVQWVLRQLDDDFLEVCILYPQNGSAENTIGVTATPFYAGNAYPVFNWDLSPPTTTGDGRNSQCGAMQMTSYSTSFVESVYEMRPNAIPGQQFAGFLRSTGPYSYQAIVSYSGNNAASPTDVQRADQSAFVTDFNASNSNLRVEVAVNGEIFHDVSVEFVFSDG